MILTIHRGTQQIGGSCVEFKTADGARIICDLGMPMAQPDGSDWPWGTASRPTDELIAEGILPDITGLYARDEPTISAVILTHAHLDHWGLAQHVHPDIPVYGTAGSLALLEVSAVFVPDAKPPSTTRELPNGDTITIGPFTVTTIPVDHSAPDSCALLVAANGKRVLYSGDLRAHGRTGHRFKNLLTNPPRDIDALVLEGTTIGQPAGSHGLPSEADVEESLVELLGSTSALVAMIAAGQGLDRAVTAFRAAKRSERQLVLDPYQAYVLHRLSPLSKNVPQYSWDGIRVKFVSAHVKALEKAGLMKLVYDMADQAKVSKEQIAESPGDFLLLARSNMPTVLLLEYLPEPAGTQIAWSMWDGYWERDRYVREFCEKWEIEPHFIHSGGHAHP